MPLRSEHAYQGITVEIADNLFSVWAGYIGKKGEFQISDLMSLRGSYEPPP